MPRCAGILPAPFTSRRAGQGSGTEDGAVIMVCGLGRVNVLNPRRPPTLLPALSGAVVYERSPVLTNGKRHITPARKARRFGTLRMAGVTAPEVQGADRERLPTLAHRNDERLARGTRSPERGLWWDLVVAKRDCESRVATAAAHKV
jgi:hypothetical protein